ncbi:hypothetical protein M899_0516 [Bacteriovorax sp. BSW11_IV]|uniref:hypothetical protein n=1 Tax=Bacteriovorax sp. BSW11_IV TaxID=1353529 RepID=UPI00038A2767|nr:hypothetical protein [Bacteriovorax sp. BSW11_IV]EQC44962.1 hypothetical protein M899_0516 [Bacteriovorax sp. BSW11_IV]
MKRAILIGLICIVGVFSAHNSYGAQSEEIEIKKFTVIQLEDNTCGPVTRCVDGAMIYCEDSCNQGTCSRPMSFCMPIEE